MNLLAVAVAGRGLVDPAEPVFGAGDDALLRGRAVFETLRVYGGRPFLLDAHLERLRGSSARMRLPEPDLAACHELAELVVGAAGETELALRFFWTGTTLVSTCGAIDPKLEELRSRGVRLAVVRASRGEHTRAKSTSYAQNMTAQDDAIEGGADDALLVTDDGIVLEAPTANIWWRAGDKLFTPSLDLPILAGVTRALMLELLPETVEEGIYPLEHILAADEVFTTSSVREVMPVRAIGAKEWYGIGAVTDALEAALRARAADMSELSALHEALLSWGLEDWIPLPEAVSVSRGLAPDQRAVEAVSGALQDLLRAERIQVWEGQWAAEPSPILRERAFSLLCDHASYSYDSESDGRDRVYYVNVENLRA